MPEYLSHDWMQEALKLADGIQPRPGNSIVIQHVVTDCPAGAPDIRWYQAITDGRFSDIALGEHSAPDVTVTETYEVSLKLNSGKMTPSAAFLSGKVKPRGNVPKMMSMTPLLQSPDFKAWDDARAAMTDA